jgi:AcrR family transcriptional regulator
VLEATFAEVSDTALAGLSVDRVAARAGVSKATIYRRLPTKAALVVNAWRGAT